MTFVEVPAGSNGMGYKRVTEKFRRLTGYNDELFSQSRLHYEQVRIDSPFWLSRYEVTREQFSRFVEETGYVTDNERLERKENWREVMFPASDNHPVTRVSLNDAVAFCTWLSDKERKHYRLPTETEWEYACRGGSQALFSFGDDVTAMPKYGNIADQTLDKMPEIKSEPAMQTTEYTQWDDNYAYLAPVGSFLPNEFGLYDMHGNTAEICSDFFRTRDRDGLGPSHYDYCVVRGGAWNQMEAYATSFFRLEMPRNQGTWITGFRIVQERTMSKPDLDK